MTPRSSVIASYLLRPGDLRPSRDRERSHAAPGNADEIPACVIGEAVARAEASAWPDPDTLEDGVYAG